MKLIGYINLRNDNGFSFISILIALVIVGILATVAITQYKQLGAFGKERNNPQSFTRRLDVNLTMNTLKQIHMMEENYKLRYNRFATFEDLQRDGAIPGGYTASLQAQGKPYLNYWDVQIQADEETYLLLAVPNRLADEFEDVPILAMNETGKIWEEEGAEGVDESTEEEFPDPFGSQ